MLRNIFLGAALSITLLPQPSQAMGGADVAAAQRWTAAAYATDPAQRCANVYGAQYWFLGPTAPNCVQPNVGRPYIDQAPRY
jgi:membrane protein YqaA with SNARE-associated domain